MLHTILYCCILHPVCVCVFVINSLSTEVCFWSSSFGCYRPCLSSTTVLPTTSMCFSCPSCVLCREKKKHRSKHSSIACPELWEKFVAKNRSVSSQRVECKFCIWIPFENGRAKGHATGHGTNIDHLGEDFWVQRSHQFIWEDKCVAQLWEIKSHSNLKSHRDQKLDCCQNVICNPFWSFALQKSTHLRVFLQNQQLFIWGGRWLYISSRNWRSNVLKQTLWPLM